jgi:hypothetical protein
LQNIGDFLYPTVPRVLKTLGVFSDVDLEVSGRSVKGIEIKA